MRRVGSRLRLLLRRLTRVAVAVCVLAGAAVVAAPTAHAGKVLGYIWLPMSSTSVNEGDAARYHVCRSTKYNHFASKSKGIFNWELRFSPRDADDNAPKANSGHFTATSGEFTIGKDDKCAYISVPTVENNTAWVDLEYEFVLTQYQHKNHSPDELITTQVTAEAVASVWTTIKDDDHVVLEVADVSAAEGSNLVFTVKSTPVAGGDGLVPGGFTIVPGLTSTNAESDDYRPCTSTYTGSSSLRFNGTKNETKQVTVCTTNDSVDEIDETVTLSLFDTVGYKVDSSAKATGVILDDDTATISLSPANPTVAEGSEGDVTVTMGSVATEHPFQVYMKPSGGTATSSLDYVWSEHLLDFSGAAGESFDVGFYAFADADTSEGSETVFRHIELWNNVETPTLPSRQTITISDAEAVSPSLKIIDASVSEGGMLDFLVQAKGRVDVDTYGTYTVGVEVRSNGTTASSSDYGTFECYDYDYDPDSADPLDPENGVHNLAGQGNNVPDNHYCLFQGAINEAHWLRLNTVEDTVMESNETIELRLVYRFPRDGAEVFGSAASQDTATGVIVDDDGVVLEVDDVSATEGGNLVFTITGKTEAEGGGGVVSGGFTVTPTITSVTAQPGDYSLCSAGSIAFAGTKNETKQVTVCTTDDNVDEVDKTITLSLSTDKTSVVYAADTATGVILDDDTAAVSITPANPTLTEGEETGLTVALGGVATESPFKVVMTTSDGTATSPADYQSATYVVDFTGAAYESSTKNFYALTDADAAEGSETVLLDFSLSDNVQTPTLPSRQTITISDAAAVTPKLTISDASASEGAALDFEVAQNNTLLDPHYGAYSVGVEVLSDGTTAAASDYGTFQCYGSDSDGDLDTGNRHDLSQWRTNAAADGIEGNEVPGNHYCTFDGNANETHWLRLSTTADTNAEVDETVELRLVYKFYSDWGKNADVLGPAASQDTATGVIADDDRVVLEVGNVSAAEGGNLVFTVTSTPEVTGGGGVVSGGFTVTPAIAAVTAETGDYSFCPSGSVVFAGTKNETKQVTVCTTDDTVDELDETFTLSIPADNADLVDSTATATGTITDNDTAAVSITPTNPTLAEGEEVDLTIALGSVATEHPFKVTLATSDGTATSPADYIPVTRVLDFTGTAAESFNIGLFAFSDAASSEGSETVTLDISLSDNVEAPTSPSRQTITITDTTNTTPSLRISDADVSEGGMLEFAVQQNNVAINPAYDAYTVGVTVLTSGTASAADYGTFECYGSTSTNTLDTTNRHDLTAMRENLAVDSIEGNEVPDNHHCLFNGNANELHWLRLNTIEDTDTEPDETIALRLTYKFYKIAGQDAVVFGPASSQDTATGTITNDDITTTSVGLTNSGTPNWLNPT